MVINFKFTYRILVLVDMRIEFHHLLNMTLVSVWMSIRVQISTYDAFHNVLFRLPLRAIHVF